MTFANMTRRAWLAGVAGLSLLSATAATAQEKDDVVLGALRFTSHGAGFVAFEKGYFDEENLNVSFEFFQAAQPIAVATASGDVDFGLAGVTGGMMNLAEKDAVRIVGGVLHEKKGVDGMMVMASNQAYEDGLDTVPEIKGHSMAMTQVGSTFHYMTSRIADAEGFDISDVRLVPLQKVGAMVAALKSGQVDAMIMVPHIAKPLVEAGAAKELGWLYDYAEYQISTLFTSVDNIENNRDMVERFIRAYAKGIADFNRVMLAENPDPAELDEMTRMIAKYVAPDKPYEEAMASIQQGAMNLNEGLALNMTDVAAQMQWFKDQNLVDSDLAVDQLVDDSFVETY
ncbi:ABC transporter substrate-binding protein [Pseudooceanicola marinus]|uniref:ABC transporter substrate-binding protein n=1 Tax=Pseudooceanicola marinus TaxID=396013 RepID=UPI001C93C1C9|nr:ABC transporter substrate-binding protein [Pseudooceanicola marinus]MBY5974559.1 ABC transporter substrate-binding protein [Ferrimonas balearica]MCA1334228.1 ABC transporter substrate-binding protein [Pseudooceanicola marinus]